MSWIERLREIVAEEQGKIKMVAIKRSGRRAENNAKRALNILQNKKKISSFFQTPTFSEGDRSGIDFIVNTLSGKKIFLQVKSHIYPEDVKSWKLFEINRDRRIWKKKGIYYIEAGGKENLNRIIAKISKIIEIEE